MRVILSVKVVWVAVKDADVSEKVWTTSIMVRKSRVDMDTCCSGCFDVLSPAESVGVGNTGRAEDAGVVGNGVVIARAMDGAI